MRIGEVSRRSGVSARMLRHYDRIGLVQPSERTGAGYRDYSEDDLRRLLQVEALRSLENERALDEMLVRILEVHKVWFPASELPNTWSLSQSVES